MSEFDRQGRHKADFESQTERFVVSQDPISQERFRFVEGLAPDLSHFPFYKALSLKGSLSKGVNMTETDALSIDINMGVFLDAQEILGLSIEDLSVLCREYNIDDNPDTGPITINEGKYNLYGSQKLLPGHLVKIRLARKLVESFIKERGKWFFIDPQTKPKGVYPEVTIISEEGPFSIYSTLLEYESSSDKSQVERENVTRALVLPFGMKINGDLFPYFKSFFDVLDSLDIETAEQKWQSVRKAIIGNERWGKVNPIIDAQIPRNLEEAKKMYLNQQQPVN